MGQYQCCVVLWVLKYFRIRQTHVSLSLWKLVQNQRVAGFGCFKNLEEWVVFLKPSNNRQRIHGSLAGSWTCDVFEIHSYIPKLIPLILLITYEVSRYRPNDGHEPNCGLEPTWFSCKESARYNSGWYPTWYPDFKAYITWDTHFTKNWVFFLKLNIWYSSKLYK